MVSPGSAENVTITRGDNSQSSVSIPGAVISEEEGIYIVHPLAVH